MGTLTFSDYTIWLEDHFEYIRLVKEYPLGVVEAQELFSKDFIKNEDGYMVRVNSLS